MFIISDGRINNQKGIIELVRNAHSKNILVVFVIIDSPDSKNSILEIKSYSFGKKMNCSYYIDDFPFPYYIILDKINNLPYVLADTLRQWFELLQRM